MSDVIPGNIYEHYKHGDRYRVIAIAKDHETQEPMVVYRKLYGDLGTYVRPLGMFAEYVLTPLGRVPRFSLVNEETYVDFDSYQRMSRKTAIYPDLGKNIVFPTLGMMGEAGEVAEKIKKVWRDRGGHPTREDRQAIAKEMGDVLWYLSQLATELRISFNEIAARNIDKITGRKRDNRLHGSGDNR